MTKREMKMWAVAVGCILAAVAFLLVGGGRQATADDVLDYWVHLPLVVRGFEPGAPMPTAVATPTSTSTLTATPTHTPTPTPTATPTPTSTPIPPVAVGSQVAFSSLSGQPFVGVVTFSAAHAYLYDAFWCPDNCFPEGVYVVVLVDVTNVSMTTGNPGPSIAIRDGVGRTFVPAGLKEQWVAEGMYASDGNYWTEILPGFTKSLAFVFDVVPPPQGLYLVPRF